VGGLVKVGPELEGEVEDATVEDLIDGEISGVLREMEVMDGTEGWRKGVIGIESKIRRVARRLDKEDRQKRGIERWMEETVL
jgi:hypothetical protein